MPATLANYDAALKEMWPSDQLEDQLFNGTDTLDLIERTSRWNESTKVGQQAVVPIKVSRPGGFSAVPAAGSAALNAAGNVGMAQATYQYAHFWEQMKIENAAMSNTSDDQAVVDVLDSETEGHLDAVRKQLERMMFGNGDALIAQCTTTSSSATVNLLSTGYGPDALDAGWLHEGQVIDIGTTASEGSVVADATISAVSLANDTITIGSSVTTSSSHYVSIANGRSGTTSYETNGLQNIISSSATLGGITVASQPRWASTVDSTTTTISLDALLTEKRAITRQAGTQNGPTDVVASLLQADRIYQLQEAKIRFAGDGGLSTANNEGTKVYGMVIRADPNCPNRHIFLLRPKDLFIVRDKPPHWISDITGGGKMEWAQGTTAFVSALIYNMNVCAVRRNSMGQFNALT